MRNSYIEKTVPSSLSTEKKGCDLFRDSQRLPPFNEEMITFAPYPDVEACAKALDYRRLGKQRCEAYQIWRALMGLSSGWINHPATQMWKGHTCFLALYCNAMIDEWIARGYRNFMNKLPHCRDPRPPWWWGWPPLHLSHQASLNRKLPSFYTFPETDHMDWGYVWPTKSGPHLRDAPLERICEPLK